MARNTTSLADATALRNELRSNWIELLKSKPNDVSCSSKFWDRQPEFEAETAEFCLLITIMFPKYSEIAMEDLVIYGMGLEIFEDVLNDMMEMRYVFGKFIDTMNRRHPSEKDEYQNRHVEMEAKANELAMSIASRFVLARGLIRENWLKTNSYKYFRGLSLVLKRVREYPVKLKCPKLVLLQLKYRNDSLDLPVDIFEGMKELRVLSLDVPSLPQSLDALRNLQTLRLNLLESAKDISAIGSLINLKFLSISTFILTDIPREMGQLGNLRLLDLRKMNLAYIPPGVLSEFLKLEELYLPLSFRMWGCKAKEVGVNYDEFNSGEEDGYDKSRINASLSEIASLSVKSLQVSVQKASVLRKRSSMFNHIRRFKILVQNNLTYQQFDEGPLNKLQLSGDARDIKESGICELLSRTEILNLTRVRNLKSVMYQLEDDDFSQMKKMIVTECDEVEYVVDTTEKRIAFSSFCKLESLHLSMLSNLKEIWYGARPHFRWFENLRQINIRFCHKLKHVFPVSMVRGLRQLQSIEIVECNEMEGIFYRNERDDNTFGFYYIEELNLHSLPKLVGFLVQKDNIIDAVHDARLRNREATTDRSLTINKVSHIVKEHADIEMQCVFSSKLIEKRLESLKKLKIAFCDAIWVIFWFNKNHDTTTRVLDSLKELELYGLRNLTHIWFQMPPETMAFRNLQLLILSGCHNLYVLSPRVAKLLVSLQKVQISRCEKMEEIVVEENDEDLEAITNKIVFPRLKELELQYMPNLKIFYCGSSAIELPLLETLKLNQCNKMESFSYESPIMPMLERIHIDGSSYSLTGDLNATMKCHQAVTTS